MTAATNHRVSGTSATAVMRCIHQCSTPSFAEPSPIARPSGERIRDAIMSGNPARDPGDPGNKGQHAGRPDDDPAADIHGFEVERVTGVQDEVTDAIAQMIEQRHRPAEQQQEPEPRTEEILDTFINLRPRSGGDEPPHQKDSASAQHYPGGTVENGEDGGELP